MFLDFEASTLAGWLVSYSVPEDMKTMRKKGWTGEDGVFGMKVVEVVLLPTKTGYGSALGWRMLKQENKLQEGELGKKVASGKRKRLDKELCCRGRWRWQKQSV